MDFTKMTFRYTVFNQNNEILGSGWVRDEDITELFKSYKKRFPSDKIEIIIKE